MERQLLDALYQLVQSQRVMGDHAGCTHRDWMIVLAYLWAVFHDRPVCWATAPESWPEPWAASLPSGPTMSRRLKTRSVWRLLVRILLYLQAAWPRQDLHWVDGKPLPVGGASHDRDAQVGYAVSMLARGYRIHAIYNAAAAVEAWTLTPMDQSEARVARGLLHHMQGQGFLVGDNHYDANYLYDAAAQAGMQLVTSPLRSKVPRSTGHRRQSPHRLAGLALRQAPLGKALIKGRFGIDRIFGHQGNIPHGLSPLPNFVRHLHRVRLWLLGKFILYAFYRNEKSRLTG